MKFDRLTHRDNDVMRNGSTPRKRIARDSLASFNALKKERMRPIFFQLQKRGNRRQEIGDHRFVNRNHVSLFLKFLNFFQTGLHIVADLGAVYDRPI